ncbi:MAG: efflux RND transporter periplasmic adaptor subunit [Verrucomicrobiales bacterium]|nr:efflux RND transporter periplasmic adaptor subunit [Verrucomicrobiales bacterium]
MAAKQSGGWVRWAVILLIAGAAIVAGVWYFKHGKSDVVQYQATAVDRGEVIQTVTATGTLNPVVNVTVGSQVSGRISKLYVDFNSPVKQGEILAEIDPSTYQATVEQVTADLANARANLELQQVQFQRASELITNKLISGSDYDIALAALHQAEATVKIKQASLNNALVNLNYCKIVSPVDGVVISRAVELGQTVASSFNTPTIFQIANDLTKMQIDSNVAEADVGGVEEKQDVTFLVDAYPYRTFRGTVTQVRNSPTTINNVVTYDCVIGVNNPDYKLKPGMTANVSIIIAQRDDALKIPNGALRFHPPKTDAAADAKTNSPAASNAQTALAPAAGGDRTRGDRPRGEGRRGGKRDAGGKQNIHTVYVLKTDADGNNPTLTPVQIKTGITDGINTEVLEGLNEGDKVVTGTVSTGAPTTAATANPFGGGGMPRMR